MTLRCAAQVAALAAALAASNPCSAVGQQTRVSPFLPDGHWAIELARTLDGLGHMPAAYDPALRRQSAVGIAASLAAAAPHSSLAADGLARLEEELGVGFWRDRRWAAGTARFGAESRVGRLLVGQRETGQDTWSPPFPRQDRVGPTASVAGRGRYGRVAVALDAGVDSDGLALREGYAMVALGPVGLWAGTLTDGFTSVPTGSVVVTSTSAGPGGGVTFLEPVRLPSVLRVLGPVGFTTHLFRAHSNGVFEEPWLWMMRGTIAPSPRLDLGVSRAIMLGGAGNDEFDARSLLYALIGKHSGAFDNQIVAVTTRYRLPTESVLPLVASLEWGFEDSAGAWRDVPGIAASLESPALPLAVPVSAGIAVTRFADACCGNPIWYRNFAFEGGWSDAGHPLGHPLGGHGHEWLAFGQTVLEDGRVRIEAAAFSRWRGEENLLAPLREGRSAGGRAEVTLLPLAGWRGYGAAEVETGLDASWREHQIEAGVVVHF